MRIATFAPAIFALGLFAATTQALPTPAQNTAVDLFKRDGNSAIDAVVDVFVKANVKVHADIAAHIHADACLDVNLDLDVEADVLGGLVTAGKSSTLNSLSDI